MGDSIICISIHATHTGGDIGVSVATLANYISIHATHTGGDGCVFPRCTNYHISIHATHTGGDRITGTLREFPPLFQSTPPIRVATLKAFQPLAPITKFQSTPPIRVATANFKT